MARGRRPRSADEHVLRSARRILARIAHEIVEPARRQQAAGGLSKPLTAGQRRRIVGFIADLKLSIMAMKDRRDQLGREAGMVLQRRDAVTAYHRTSLLAKPGRRRVPRSSRGEPLPWA